MLEIAIQFSPRKYSWPDDFLGDHGSVKLISSILIALPAQRGL